MEIGGLYQSADWKAEKHVPVMEISGAVKKGEFFTLSAGVGKQIPHPNKTEHHIRWIDVYFLARGEKFPCQLGRGDFTAHGESAQGADTSGIYTHPEIVLRVKTDKPGTLFAAAYCNIHGLWQSSREIELD